MKNLNNLIEVLKEYGNSTNVFYSYTHISLFFLDEADSLLFDAREDAKRLNLYKRETKQYLNKAYDNTHRLCNLLRSYLDEDIYDTLDKLDQYHDEAKGEIFMLYNTLLKDSSSRFFTDYEVCKLCTTIDTAHILIQAWVRLCDRVIGNFPAPFNQVTNNYDTMIRTILFNTRQFVKSQINVDDDVEELSEAQKVRFAGSVARITNYVRELGEKLLKDEENTTTETTEA